MYPASFPGLGRGLDFLLPSFLVSRQEKKLEARLIRLTEYQFNDDEYAKRVHFQGYSFHRWNVLGAYAIRPYLGTSKHDAFTAFILNETPKRTTFFDR